ncbi:MAG: metallophosphoesterase, partial [Dysgonamonadaceae bacterium]|nr:metallophosphoesterase [Dysgonamonadaceae bacterium]
MKTKNYMNRKTLLTVLALALVGIFAWAQDFYRLYKDGVEIARIQGNPIDSVKVEGNDLNFYRNGAVHYTQTRDDVDSITFATVPDAAAQWTVASPGNMEWYKWGNNNTVGTPATGVPATVAGPGDIQAWALQKEDHIKITLPFTAPATVYTLLWDIRVPSLSGYCALLQTNKSNTDDGDVFLKDKTLGSGDYSAEVLSRDTWHRIVVSVNVAAQQILFYVDGRKVSAKNNNFDRYSLSEFFWLFLDDTNEDYALDCAGIALWNVVLSAEQISILGGATPYKPGDGEQPESILPRFAVISDIHFGNGYGDGPMVKVPKALKNIVAKGGLDAIFVVGDLTNNGTESEYDQMNSVFKNTTVVPANLPVYYLMGNHDNFTDAQAASIYQAKTGQPLHQYVEIKGYPFITISQTGRWRSSYDDEAQNFLRSSLANAAAKYPGKPIFVFVHVPPENTCYGSLVGHGENWGSDIFPPILSPYPQVISFSGHSHFPLGDPRSINQKDYTAVNDGSTTYAEIENNVVDIGTRPERFENITEGVIVNVLENGNVEMERWDTYRNEEMLPRWLVEAPFDGSKFTYKNMDGLPAPVFADNIKPIVSDIDETMCTVTFSVATDNEVVHRYLIEIVDENQDSITSKRIFSQFYLNSQAPKEFSTTFLDLPNDQSLRAQVTALDSYGNPSTPPIQSEPFIIPKYVPDPNAQLQVADLLDVRFDANGAASDVSAQHNTVIVGSTTPQTYFNPLYDRW